MTSIPIVIDVCGNIRMVFDDRFDASGVGKVRIKRGSHVESTSDGRWTADLSPVDGPTVGPFDKRKDALAAELAWLHANWLTTNSP